MRHVIVGDGPAGVVAAETLRHADPDAEITLLGDEAEAVYSRMAIPYFLAGNIGEEGTRLRSGDAHFAGLGIACRKSRVTSLDTDAHRLTLADGGTLDYDRLLIATGSHAVRPPVEGLEDVPGIHHCWTLADARAIAARAAEGSRVALMGAGFIGCIILEALVERGVDLTVIEMGDRMVPRMMDATAGGLIKHWCMNKGVRILTGTQVRSVSRNGKGFTLQCEPEYQVEADLVVIATGVRPNTDLLAGSGIEVGNGIVVDARQQTSAPDVYAAGDVCEGMDWNTGQRAINAIQPAAVETARIAALNMAGTAATYPGSLAMNVLDTLGLISASYGRWQGVEGGETATALDPDRYHYICLQFEEDRLVGAITLGLTQHVGVLRGLIQARTRLGAWKDRLLADPSRFMDAYLAMTHPAS